MLIQLLRNRNTLFSNPKLFPFSSVEKVTNNANRSLSTISQPQSSGTTETDDAAVAGDAGEASDTISKAMQSYIQRAKEYRTFVFTRKCSCPCVRFKNSLCIWNFQRNLWIRKKKNLFLGDDI